MRRRPREAAARAIALDRAFWEFAADILAEAQSPDADPKFHVSGAANGQGNSYCGSLAEARRRVTRRAEYDPPPPGIFPAEIWEAVVDLDTPEDERRAVPMEWHFVARIPAD